MIAHCQNLTADRALGKEWERNFCRLAADYGFMFSPLQIGHNGSAVAYTRTDQKWNKFTLPDDRPSHPGQHHEIKHKNPTRDGWDSKSTGSTHGGLLLRQHGSTCSTQSTTTTHPAGEMAPNWIEHWLTVRVEDSGHARKQQLASYVNNKRRTHRVLLDKPGSCGLPRRACWNETAQAAALSPDELTNGNSDSRVTMSYSKTIIVGNLGADAEMRYTPSGAAVSNFRVAVNERWNNREGQPQEKTTWFRVAVWGKQAEAINQYLVKGKQVLVEGSVEASAHTGQHSETGLDERDVRLWASASGNNGGT